MNNVPKSCSLLLLVALAPTTLMLLSTNLCAQPAKGGAASVVRRVPPQDEKERMNAWTVGLAGGLLEGAPLRLAAEMARVVDDGPNLHVLPIVTRGATENLNSLLYLRGVDTAIINSDALEEYKIQVPEIRRRITLPAQSLPIGAAYLCPARDREPAGSRWQEGKFQHPGHGCGLLGATDLQPPRHQRRKDFHSPPDRAGADAQRRDSGRRFHHVEAG